MNEPTDMEPGHDALFKALKDLVVEAQAVADDHHRPRFARLDQALASARNAMLDYWAATPQPTQAQAGAVPLTDEQCDAIYEALDFFGREVCHYEYGLPYCTSDGETLAKTEAREVIRQAAHGIKGGQHG